MAFFGKSIVVVLKENNNLHIRNVTKIIAGQIYNYAYQMDCIYSGVKLTLTCFRLVLILISVITIH